MQSSPQARVSSAGSWERGGDIKAASHFLPMLAPSTMGRALCLWSGQHTCCFPSPWGCLQRALIYPWHTKSGGRRRAPEPPARHGVGWHRSRYRSVPEKSATVVLYNYWCSWKMPRAKCSSLFVMLHCLSRLRWASVFCLFCSHCMFIYIMCL